MQTSGSQGHLLSRDLDEVQGFSSSAGQRLG
jgi:hypothetical protein